MAKIGARLHYVRPRRRQRADHLHPSLYRWRGLASFAVCSVAFCARPQRAAPVAAGYFKPYRCIRLGGRSYFGHRGRCIRACGGSQAGNAPTVAAVVLSRGRPFIGIAAFPFAAGAASCRSRA